MDHQLSALSRIRLWYVLLLVVFGGFVVRLFYLQIIKHDYYRRVARSDQIREYDVPAERGVIMAQLNGRSVPLVMNEKLYTVFADPSLVKKPGEVARAVSPILHMKTSEVEQALRTKDTRYVVLKKRVAGRDNDAVLALKYAGIASQQQHYRTYPQGVMASQLLGFVNDEGKGNYGVEQALNGQLSGQNGRLKAVTDVHGIPLPANADNLIVSPVPGKTIELTIDIGMQRQVERIVQQAQEKFKSKNVSAIVLETNTGAVKAMANYPTYNPAKYAEVQDAAVLQNYAVAHPIEPGSITKVFSTAAGLDSGAIKPTSTYNDPGSWTIDGAKVVNVAEGKGSGQQTIRSMLNKSLNTGATWVLMQMGGGKLNEKGRQTLYEYYSARYGLGATTGIEQGYEGEGYLVGPKDKDNGINITYANMSFGQGYSASAIQMGAALSAIVNGGTYYQPHLVRSAVSTPTETESGTSAHKDQGSKVVRNGVVSPETSRTMVELLDYVTIAHAHEGFPYMDFGDNYSVGGKTGTAEITKDGGGYRDDVYNGTFMGYVGGDQPQYTIVVYNIEPHGYSGYAGAQTGQPIFADIAHMLINNYDVTPKSR